MPQSELTARQIAELPKPQGSAATCIYATRVGLPRAAGALGRADGDLAAVPLRFLIATAARRKEARLVRWPEVDLTAGVWIIPTERMKGRRPHRVPLSDAARDVRRGVTAHGFRDWAAHNKVPEEQARATLAVVVGGTLGTYQRNDLLQARRPVMRRWARLLMAPARAEAKMVMIPAAAS